MNKWVIWYKALCVSEQINVAIWLLVIFGLCIGVITQSGLVMIMTITTGVIIALLVSIMAPYLGWVDPLRDEDNS